MRTTGRIAATVGVLIATVAVTFLVTTAPAHAYTIGKCRFAGSAPTIQYQFFVIGPQ